MTRNATSIPDDVLIVGAGVIGLSLAYELAGRGLRVRLLDRGSPGSEASWAGAGILPPAASTPRAPLEALLALSNRLHAEWAAQLQDEVGIDNGFRRCGGVYLVLDDDPLTAQLRIDDATEAGIDCRGLSAVELAELEPSLAGGRIASADFRGAVLLPGEAQIRNPWHLRALEAGAAARGVTIEPGIEVRGFQLESDRVRGVETDAGVLVADKFCLAGGAWSGGLLSQLGQTIPLRPIRGQIVLLGGGEPRLRRIVNVGRRYLVPRQDGRVLLGSTEEDAGFDRSTTAAGVAGLLAFGLSVAPGLDSLPVERSWAGLRPSTDDGLPCLGRVPGWANAFVATGHYRSGLQLSAATARVLAQAICGEAVEVDISELGLERFARPSGQAHSGATQPAHPDSSRSP